MRRKSKSPQRKIQDQLWQECRRIALKRFCNSDGSVDCYTCGAKNLLGSNRQLGHMWAKASVGANLKYDLRILRWQCNKCNGYFGGMGADFYKRMLAEIGKENMTKLEQDRNITTKSTDHYLQLLDEYSKM